MATSQHSEKSKRKREPYRNAAEYRASRQWAECRERFASRLDILKLLVRVQQIQGFGAPRSPQQQSKPDLLVLLCSAAVLAGGQVVGP